MGGKKLDLEMIYEDDVGEMIGEDSFSENGPKSQNLGHSSGNGRNPKLGHSLLMMKRSRSLPQEEFVYLSQKLKEIDLMRRTDSIISGQSGK